MLSVEIRKQQLDRLAKATARAGKKMKKELAGAINQVSKKTKLQMGRDIRNTVNLKRTKRKNLSAFEQQQVKAVCLLSCN